MSIPVHKSATETKLNLAGETKLDRPKERRTGRDVTLRLEQRGYTSPPHRTYSPRHLALLNELENNSPKTK